MRWISRLVTVALAVSFSTAALGADEVKLQLKWIPQFQFAGYYVALDKGYYSDSDLDVSIQPGGVDVSSMQMVASGSAEFGVASPDQIFLSRDKGLEAKGIMNVFQYSPTMLMVKKESGIESPKDFPGNTAGISFGELTEIEYRQILSEEGVDSSEINEIKKEYNLARFLKDDVQIWSGYITNEPYQARKEGAEVRTFQGKEFGVEFYGDTLVAKTEYIEENPDLVDRFVDASRRGWVYAMLNPDETVEILSEYSDKKKDQLEYEAETTIPLLKSEQSLAHGFGWMEEDRLDYTQRKLKEAGMVDELVDVETTMTNEFLQP